MGAWEIAGRFSYLDLNDKAIQGGTITDYTAGLNWYLNPYTKLMLNDVYSTDEPRVGANGYLNTVEMRAQIDF